MNVVAIVREAVRTVKQNRALWFFGFFVASSGGTGFNYSRSGESAPAWLVPALIAVGILALGTLFLHIVSESALIEGVRRARRGERPSVKAGMRTGMGLFGRMVALKAGALGVVLATVAAAAVPLAAVALSGGPLWAGAIGSAILAVFVMPWLLSVYFTYEYAMRAMVVEDLGVRAAVRGGFRFLHGRIALSLGLAIASSLGEVAAGAIGLVFALPIAAIGGLVYLAAGLVPAAVTAGVLLAPVVVCLTGALGAYRSSIWTHAYLEERGLTA
jgi:hypothetical protein